MYSSSAHGFLPSESGSSNLIKAETTKKKNSSKNLEKQTQREAKKLAKQDKKQFRKALRKAVFKNYKPKLFKKKAEKRGSLKDGKNPSVISIIASIAGFVFFLSVIPILFVPILSTLFGVLAYLVIGSLLVGIIAGTIGLITKDETKHDIKKTKLLSLIGLSTGLVAVLLLVLTVLLFQ